MSMVRVSFGDGKEVLAQEGWHWIRCRSLVPETSKANNRMYTGAFVLTGGYTPFRQYFMLAAAEGAWRRLRDIHSLLRLFDVAANERGRLPWPGVRQDEQAFDLGAFMDAEAEAYIVVEPAKPPYAPRNKILLSKAARR